MAERKTMTLNLTDAEMSALDKLAEDKDLSKTAVMRQALRLYQLVDSKIQKGERIYWQDEKRMSKTFADFSLMF